MFTLPDPLHPALVHFPIALILVGSLFAVISVIWNRWHLPWMVAILLVGGSTGAFVAAEAGEDAVEQAGELTADADSLLDTHTARAESTQTASLAAAILAIAAALAGSEFPRRLGRVAGRFDDPPRTTPLPKKRTGLSLGLRMVTAIAALAAGYFVLGTGQAGGKLVYEHGVGVSRPPVSASPPGVSLEKAEE